MRHSNVLLGFGAAARHGCVLGAHPQVHQRGIPLVSINKQSVRAKMATVKGTSNHTYSTEDRLGQGATCSVFKGLSKDGQFRALKVTSPLAMRDINREVTALRTLRHENIIRFFGTETELMTRQIVVVMEYCEGGSLQSYLYQPSNMFGLPELEFLLLLRHLVSGMEHLRSHGFVHRDIKPGNILRQIDENGKSVFKLSDFGTARPLGDDEYFKSIVGTPEYLHPDLFNAAFGVIDTDKSLAFPHSVDLWSLGVTIYYAATGSVPFSPHRHETKAATMFEMISQKPRGAIGARQHKAKGEIQWIFSLPDTCQLSGCLRKILLPVLVGLFEKDPALGWSFERFFQESKNILQKKQVMYLSLLPSKAPFDEIFISGDSELSYDTLKEQLTMTQLDHGILELEDLSLDGMTVLQDILYRELSLKDWLQENEQEYDIPVTDANAPLILLPAEVLISPERDRNLFTEPFTTDDISGETLSFQKMCAVIMLIHRCIVTLATLQQHLCRLKERQKHKLRKAVWEARKTFLLATELFDVIKGTANMADWTNQENSMFKEVVQKMSQIERLIERSKNMVEVSPGKQHADFSGKECTQITQRAQEEAQTCIKEMEELKKNMDRKFITNHQQNCFEALRKKLEGSYERVQNLWQNQGPHKSALLRQHFLTWYRSHLQLLESVEKCCEDLSTVIVLVSQLFKSCVNRAGETETVVLSKKVQKSLLDNQQRPIDKEQLSSLLTGLQHLAENLEAPEIFDVTH